VKFNIQPQDLQQMIGKLAQYSSSISTTASSMRSYANQLSSSWQDPQYIGFVDQVDAIGRSLKTSEETLKRMEHQLSVLKRNLERTHADYMKLR
jgi:uncharacterized protein YukE